MIDVRWIGASPSWWALLKGQVEVGRLTLYQPTIVLETDANGVPNWQFKPGAAPPKPKARRPPACISRWASCASSRARWSYTNPQTKQTLKAEQVEATASVGSCRGRCRLPAPPR
jgi:uncharacterized protein involved in outer membrane biogenesis